MRTRSKRHTGTTRDRTVLESIALFAGPKGVLPSSTGMVERVIGIDRRRVGEALKQLGAWGALTGADNLAYRRLYWTGKLDWRDAEPIIIAEQYRSQEDERRQLGD